jgi:hypothetical protein
MPYMLLIVERGDRRDRSPEERRRAYDRMVRFGEDLKARGLYKASDSLRPDTEGVRVEVRGGQRMVVEGPFAESKEFVGGFFLLDCRSREEAITIAGECPAVEWASVEVREVAPCYE